MRQQVRWDETPVCGAEERGWERSTVRSSSTAGLRSRFVHERLAPQPPKPECLAGESELVRVEPEKL